MHDLVLFLGMMFYVPVSLVSPAAGMLAWEWFSLMSPQQLVYGFAYGLHLNAVIAATTLAGWLFSQERKSFPRDALPWMLVLFFAWCTFNMLFVPYPDFVWPYWNRTMRIFVEIFLAFMILNRKTRIHGMVWILVISIGFYSVKGGLYTLLTAGSGHVLGPPDTILADNNQLAASEVLALPLMFYLARHSEQRLVRIGLRIALGLTVIAILGSYSRGGFLALSVLLFILWLRIPNKFLYAALAIVLLVAGLSVMPDAYWARIQTLSHPSTDPSFEGRVTSWHVAYYYASDHFPFGAGFYAPALGVIYHRYFPGVQPLAAHSIYFQVLGEQGFVGLAIYLVILVLGLNNARIVMRQARNQPGLEWAYDLANMIFIGLLAFYIGAAALSMAYFDGFLMLLVLTSMLREVTSPARITARAGKAERSPYGRGRFGSTEPPAQPAWRGSRNAALRATAKPSLRS